MPPKMALSRWVCKMLVELMVVDIEQNTVLSAMPICILKMISKRIPKANKATPRTIEIFRYFVESVFLSITWDNIKNRPVNPKKIMSFPLDDPIKNRWVTGRIIGFSMSVAKITPAITMHMTPSSMVLLTFINNNLSNNSLNKYPKISKIL
jgi:hypothetical protein